MTKRNTRVDDAELSDTEKAALALILPSTVPDLRKPAPKPKAKAKAPAVPPEVLKARAEIERMTATIERLQSRLFRTVNALQKLERRRRYWQKKAAPTGAGAV